MSGWGRAEIEGLVGRMTRRLEGDQVFIPCEDCGTTERETQRSKELGVTLCGQCFGKRAENDGAEPVAQDRSTWASVDLAPILAGQEVDEPPTQLERIDGTCLLYLGKLHAVHGEPETAKGWLLLHAAAEEIAKGEHVFYLDFEDDERTAVARLRAIGLGDEAIAERFHYIRPNERLNEDGRAPLEQELAAHRPSLVIIDGVTEALTLEGLSLSDNTEVAQWMEQLPRWLRDKTGAAIVLIDHVTKDRESRGRYALGAQHKLAGVDVAYSVKVVEVFGRGLSGRIQVKVHKDRPGHVRRCAIDGVVADVGLESQDDGAVAIVVQPPDPKGWRPTKRMEEVSRFLEGNDGASQRAIRESITGKLETTIEAIRFLIGDGYVKVVDKGQTSHHHSIRPYRATGSQTSGTTPPIWSGSEGGGSAGGSGSLIGGNRGTTPRGSPPDRFPNRGNHEGTGGTTPLPLRAAVVLKAPPAPRRFSPTSTPIRRHRHPPRMGRIASGGAWSRRRSFGTTATDLPACHPRARSRRSLGRRASKSRRRATHERPAPDRARPGWPTRRQR